MSVSPKKRLLTKSRFKIGCECPTKLYYNDRPTEFANSKLDDTFLKSLAEGGFQVGALAQLEVSSKVSPSVEVTEMDYESSVTKTLEHLKADKIAIFEAAVRFDDLFVRVDVLNKISPALMQVIEVKAKTIDTSEDIEFFTKRGTKRIRSEWEPYLLDIAFQTYVIQNAFPGVKTESYLMLADTAKVSTVNGLNQMFKIAKNPTTGRTRVEIQKSARPDQILTKIKVDDAVDFILNTMYGSLEDWRKHVDILKRLVTQGERAAPVLTAECKHCEFRVAEVDLDPGQKSGFLSCWKEAAGMTADDFSKRPMVFDIGNFRASGKLITDHRYFADQVTDEDLSGREGSKSGLSNSERQKLQIEHARSVHNNGKSSSVFIDHTGLSQEMSGWRFPYHFIDFETSAVALPFNAGRRPYETIAFQFSHHVMYADGQVEHRTEYIHRQRREFPNFAFVRALKAALSPGDKDWDAGTIFRYAAHENTVLCHIHDQLESSKESDAGDLMEWIRTVTTRDKKDKLAWSGKRSMVDLCDLVKRFYWSPKMGGSASIKKVLPAILHESSFLVDRYSQPIYGTKGGIKSLNFKDRVWLKRDPVSGAVQDPYKQLDPVFPPKEQADIERMYDSDEDSIANGGAAMMAYAKTQFTEMTDTEANMIFDALLRYCELDTLAMVMIVEYWRDVLKMAKQKVG